MWGHACTYKYLLHVCAFALLLYCSCFILSEELEEWDPEDDFQEEMTWKFLTIGWISLQPSSQVRFSCFVTLVSFHTIKPTGCSQRRGGGLQWWLWPRTDNALLRWMQDALCICSLKVFRWAYLGSIKTHPFAFSCFHF